MIDSLSLSQQTRDRFFTNGEGIAGKGTLVKGRGNRVSPQRQKRKGADNLRASYNTLEMCLGTRVRKGGKKQKDFESRGSDFVMREEDNRDRGSRRNSVAKGKGKDERPAVFFLGRADRVTAAADDRPSNGSPKL